MRLYLSELNDIAVREAPISSTCCGTPVSASQICTVRSYDADTSCRPSGENVTDPTKPVWPSSVFCSTPVSASQIRMVRSLDEDSCRPSGENVTDLNQ